MGCHLLLQGIFWIQGSNPCLLQVSCIAGGFFTTKPRKPCNNCEVEVAQSCPTLCDPMDSPWNSPVPFSRGSYQPRSPALKADSLPAEPQGKPKNIGVGTLFLLQLIFLTQQSIIEYQLAKQTTPHLVHINSVFLLSASNSVCQGRTCPYFLVGLSAAQPSFPINFSNVTL